jgi:hypothetical protein
MGMSAVCKFELLLSTCHDALTFSFIQYAICNAPAYELELLGEVSSAHAHVSGTKHNAKYSFMLQRTYHP